MKDISAMEMLEVFLKRSRKPKICALYILLIKKIAIITLFFGFVLLINCVVLFLIKKKRLQHPIEVQIIIKSVYLHVREDFFIFLRYID